MVLRGGPINYPWSIPVSLPCMILMISRSLNFWPQYPIWLIPAWKCEDSLNFPPLLQSLSLGYVYALSSCLQYLFLHYCTPCQCLRLSSRMSTFLVWNNPLFALTVVCLNCASRCLAKTLCQAPPFTCEYMTPGRYFAARIKQYITVIIAEPDAASLRKLANGVMHSSGPTPKLWSFRFQSFSFRLYSSYLCNGSELNVFESVNLRKVQVQAVF